MGARERFCEGCCGGQRGPCGACIGRGVVSDRIPAADALADAETLRRVVRALPLPIDAWDLIAIPDLGALRCGIACDPTRPFSATAAEFASDAQASAHLAFSAVPGLKGGAK